MKDRLGPLASVAFFLVGFGWDALTLVRVDRLLDNLLLGAYLAVLVVLLVLDHHVGQDPSQWPRLARRAGWLRAGVQFLFGGLFSAYLVFYGRSASVGPSAIFVLILAGLFVVNEFLQHLIRGVWLRLVMLGLVAFAFLLFALPVLLGFASAGLVVVAATLSGGLVLGVARLMLLDADRPQPWRRPVALALALGTALFAVDRLGWVPPMPYAVVEIGVFHSVERQEADSLHARARYQLGYERPSWWTPWVDDDHAFRQRDGESAHLFTAIFAPTGFTASIVHRWQRWDAAQGWVDTDRIDVTRRGALRGGDDLGYRTWSKKTKLTPGPWRVLVETPEGRELGRYSFDVLPGPHPPPDRVERWWG